MRYLRAYHNMDSINSFYVNGNIPNNIGQVEIYYYDDTLGMLDTYDWESYPSIEEIKTRVDYINSNKFTSI